MLVCAIETSTVEGEIALLEEQGRSEARAFAGQVAHAKGLFPCLSELLESFGAGIAQLDLFAVNCGPGSYTGIRVGVTAAKVLAFALKKPVVGVNTFEVLLRNVPPEAAQFAACILDAKLGQVYGALYRLRPLVPQIGSFVGSAQDFASRLPPGTVVFGDGVARYEGAFASFPRGSAAWDSPSALTVGEVGLRRFRSQGPADPQRLAPLYLRLSAAEQKLAGKRRREKGAPEAK